MQGDEFFSAVASLAPVAGVGNAGFRPPAGWSFAPHGMSAGTSSTHEARRKHVLLAWRPVDLVRSGRIR